MVQSAVGRISGVGPAGGKAEGCLHAYQMYTVKLKGADRAAFLTELRRRGVEASVHFDPPLHQQSLCACLFRGRRLDLPVTDRVASNIVTLPIYPGLTPEQREHVVGSVKAALLVARRVA